MFEKITDFDGKQFLNLWGGFSCECFADGINTFVMFYIKDEEILSLSGNDANDILDFVLSEYYKNENSTIEDGFSTWLMGHYDNVMPTFDKNSQPILVPKSALESAKEEKVDNQNMATITEDYVSFETAKLLNEKGFNEPCRAVYEEKILRINTLCDYLNSELSSYVCAPTHQMAMKWLREVHKVLIVIDAYHANHWEGYIDCFEINIYSHASTIIVPNEIAYHTDYTEAVEAALKYVLENLI